MEQVNVAIADDNERILDLLEEIINMDKELHVVGKAKNGEEMCQIIRNKQPDVVLLDLIMPKMDGLTVMEKINQDKNVQKRPDFIVVTAVGQERITEDAFNRGANYYIMKPFNNEMLLNRIKTVRRPVRSCEKRNDELSSQVPYIREGDLENRVTNLLHEIGIPAHIKGYHYLRDSIISAGYGCVKCDHKGVVSNRSKTVSDDIQPCGAGHPSCDRGSVESWKTGYPG